MDAKEQNNTFSGFIDDSDSDNSVLRHDFSEMEVVANRQYNMLVKAKRDGKWYILKALKKEFRDSDLFLNALRKEYDVMSQLQHPGVVDVEGFEEVEGLGPCIIIEYVNGQNLQEALKKGLSLPLRKCIAQEIIDALGYIHRKQVVHRDIKPSNIMVQCNTGYIKLIDFGSSDSDSYTYLKQPSGTEKYMAPEQYESYNADSRNDIYSLGRVLQDLQLGRSYDSIIKKCLLPIDQRYQSVADLKKDFEKKSQHINWAWVVIPILLLTTFVFFTLRYHWSEKIYSWAKDVKLTYYDFSEDGIYYNILSQDSLTLEVTNNGDVNTYSGDITVPEFVMHEGKNYRVVRLGDNSFCQCDSLVAVVLPKSIHSLGNNVFLNSTELATINLPDSVTQMGDSVMRNCVRLRSVHLPQSMTEVPRYCFSGCISLRTVYLHEGITALRRDALAGTGLDSISFPRSLKTIDRGVFWACKQMKTITIPSSVESIGDFVFWCCESMTDVYVERREPLSITNIFQDLKGVKLHVPQGTADAYSKTTGWNVLKIVEEK